MSCFRGELTDISVVNDEPRVVLAGLGVPPGLDEVAQLALVEISANHHHALKRKKEKSKLKRCQFRNFVQKKQFGKQFRLCKLLISR